MSKQKRTFLFIIALAVGVVFSLPHIIIYQKSKNIPNVFFTPFSGGDLDTYGAQIREVYEGKLFSGDAYNYESKAKFPLFSSLPSLVLGLISRLFTSVEPVFVLGNFFLTPIIFILFFKFVYKISQHFWGSISASLSTLFLYHLTTKIPPINSNMIQSLWNIVSLKEPFFFSFSRLPPIQFTYIFFFLFIICLYRTLVDKRRLWPVITGILSGVLAYIYFFHWTVSLAMLGICFCFNLLSRSQSTAKRLFLALSIALVISSGYLFQVLSVDLADKQLSEGRITGRFIEPLSTLRYGIFSLIIYWLLPAGSLRQLLLSIFLSAVGLMNLQLVTGFTMDPGHWSSSTFEPLVVISGFILILVNLKKFKLQRLAAKAWLLVIIIFLYAVLNQVAVANRYQSLYLMPGKEKKLYNWLNRESPKESVVLSLSKLISRRLPALTHNNPYLPYGSYSQISLDQIWERTNIAFSLFQFDDQAILQKLADGQFTGYLFIKTYRYTQKDDLTGLDFPQEIKTKIIKTSAFLSPGFLYIPDNIKQASIANTNLLKQQSLKERLCRYRLDYVVFDQFDQQLTNIAFDRNIFQPVFQAEDIILYQINPNLCL